MKAYRLLPSMLVGGALTVLAAAVPLTIVHRAEAQGQRPVLRNVVPDSSVVTVRAEIRAINPATREITLVARSGAVTTVTAGPDVRIETLRPGEAVRAKYYREVAFILSDPGHPVSPNEIWAAVGQKAVGP